MNEVRFTDQNGEIIIFVNRTMLVSIDSFNAREVRKNGRWKQNDEKWESKIF